MDAVDTHGQRWGAVRRVVFGDGSLAPGEEVDAVKQSAIYSPSPVDMTDMGAVDVAAGSSPWDHEAKLSDMPDALKAHLREVGFFEIEGHELTPATHYVAADHIDRIESGRVVFRPRT
jgi:hypothetical protein